MANLSPLRHPDHLLALLVRGLRNGRTHPFRYPAGRAASTPSQGGPFSACRGVRFQSAVNNSPQVMSLLPRTPTSGGSAPGTPRCASASSRAGFARLPCWGRVIPSPDPIPLTPSDLSPSTSLCYLTPCPPNRGKVTDADDGPDDIPGHPGVLGNTRLPPPGKQALPGEVLGLRLGLHHHPWLGAQPRHQLFCALDTSRQGRSLSDLHASNQQVDTCNYADGRVQAPKGSGSFVVV